MYNKHASQVLQDSKNVHGCCIAHTGSTKKKVC